MGCLFLFLAACARSVPTPGAQVSPTLPAASVTPTSILVPSATQPATPTFTRIAASPTSTFTPTVLPPDFWKDLPVIPDRLSERARIIYQNGLALGQNPRIFSRIGDCTSAAPAFLVGFDGNYNLGEYSSLQPAVDYFKGSFKRPSLAAKAGLNTAGLLSSLWTGEKCQANESLLDCQYRLDRPSFAIIAIGINEAYYVHQTPGSFERNMRLILDDTISQGILPVLGTKADNDEGDESINATIARLALEYEIPLWNFWRSVQSLPNQGLVDSEHLSSVSYANFVDFTIPNSLQYGMQMRNLTALQMLDFLREQVGTP
jgi:hypothetical protein